MKRAWPSRGLYAITPDGLPAPDLLARVDAALVGGLRVLQFRDKSGDAPGRLLLACQLKALCADHGVPFIVNDDLALALEAGADGIHLGREELHLLRDAVSVSPDFIVGVSCYDDPGRAYQAVAAGAAYVAFGSVFDSGTKPDAVRCSLEDLRSARSALRVPIVAIGGITPDNGPAVIATGVDYLAAVNGVFGQADVALAARRYGDLFRLSPPTS